jgi:hypothetical protein
MRLISFSKYVIRTENKGLRQNVDWIYLARDTDQRTAAVNMTTERCSFGSCLEFFRVLDHVLLG